MIKKLIPHYYVSGEDNEENEIAEYAHFAISPYLEELGEVHRKSFNNLIGGERVYTESMMLKVIALLIATDKIIMDRLKDTHPMLSKEPYDPNTPKPWADVWVENYNQQLKTLKQLIQIFKL